MRKSLFLVIFFLVIWILWPQTAMAQEVLIPLPKPPHVVNKDAFYGPQYFLVNEYPAEYEVENYLDEIIYTYNISPFLLAQFSNPQELKVYIKTNYQNEGIYFQKEYEYFEDTRLITRVNYFYNNEIVFTAEFIKDDSWPSPSIEGPQELVYSDLFPYSLTTLFKYFNFYTFNPTKDYYPPRLYRLFEQKEVLVTNIAYLQSSGELFLIKKYFPGYGEVTHPVKLHKKERHKGGDIRRINNYLTVDLAKKRPPESQIVRQYKAKLQQLGLKPEDLKITYSSYSLFDHSGQDDYLLFTYRIDNQTYEDKLIVTKTAIKKESTKLKYHLIFLTLIASGGGIMMIFPLFKKLFLKFGQKRKRP